VSITVNSLNPESSVIYNSPNVSALATTTVAGSTISQAQGYLVGQDGLIQFPVLGNLKVTGLTKKQLADDISKRLKDKQLLVDPIVTVRYLNFRVTVIGEVARPGVIPVPSEQINLLEALGLAGDLTIYGRRDNVLLIREQEGKKIMKSLNLNSTELLKSPYFYLRSNDVVYVEPNKTKVASTQRTNQIVPMILSGLSFTAIIFDRILRK
jgi:polysaccharide export outer membrane protein